MRSYIVSFRFLKPTSTKITNIVRDALDISYKRAEALCQKAYSYSDIQIAVSAEQLGNLQAARIINRITDELRYLCDVKEVNPTNTKLFELRAGYRTVPDK